MKLSLHKATPWLQAFLIIVVAFWLYSPVMHGLWLWDDSEEIFKNKLTLSPSGWWMNWLEPSELNAYYPIKADIQWVQWRLWGDDTLGYHLTNIVLHICSALLIWRLLGKLGLRLAWLGGLLFVVHPVTVESVAWIAEFKNAISLPPFLLAACYWIDYEERRRSRDYALSITWFLVAMLCKVTMSFFPAVILLYAWWKRGRLQWSDVKASLPFWAMAIALASMTIWLQQLGKPNRFLEPLAGLWPRLICADETVFFFFFKALWPVGMLPVYEPWHPNSASAWPLVPGMVLLAALGWCWARRKTWGRHVLLGVGFFLINLLPVIGSIQLQYSEMIWSLDHLNYLPLVGLIGLFVAGVELLNRHLSDLPRIFVNIAVAAIVILMACESCLYAMAFEGPVQLWTYILRRDPNSVTAYTNLGAILLDHYQIDKAAKCYASALQLDPESSEANDGMAYVLCFTKHNPEAIAHFETAIKHNPDYTPAYNGLANALIQKGDLAGAKATCEEVLRIDPDYVAAHCTLAYIYVRTGDHAGAVAEFETAKRLYPGDSETLKTLEAIIQKQASHP
jgi:tetratricopeptide (TPR) repeat protein